MGVAFSCDLRNKPFVLSEQVCLVSPRHNVWSLLAATQMFSLQFHVV